MSSKPKRKRKRYWVEVIETVHYKVPVWATDVAGAEEAAEHKVTYTRNRDKWVFNVSERESGQVSLSKYKDWP